MKPPYSGNGCLKGLFIRKETKSVTDFKAFMDRISVLLGAGVGVGNVAGYKSKPFVI